MTPKHAITLMILFPDFAPGQVMIGAMYLAGYIGQDGKPTAAGREVVRAAINNKTTEPLA